MIDVGGYKFEGPYENTDQLKDRSGIYVILCRNDSSSKYLVIDIGESSQVKTRVENHDRLGCWKDNCKGKLYVAVLYTPHKQQSGRKEIEQELREQYNPPCGDR